MFFAKLNKNQVDVYLVRALTSEKPLVNKVIKAMVFKVLSLNSICLYYFSLAATAASGSFVPSPSAQEIPVVSAPAPAPIPNQFPAENQPVNQNAAPQVVVNPGANQNLRMNAQGGPIVEEEDEINRDWLDWTYSAATFSVFLSILYFYSSMSRFLMVMGATIVMYL
jgi:homocysteine-responsive ER-resident protein 1 with ubiquitin-like domain